MKCENLRIIIFNVFGIIFVLVGMKLMYFRLLQEGFLSFILSMLIMIYAQILEGKNG